MALGDTPVDVPFKVVFEYLAPTMDPIVSAAGPASATFNPTKTYAEVTASGQQFDVIWVPAVGPRPNAYGVDRTPKEELDFIRAQAPRAKYILSVCSGALQLALAGVLSGKRATTNKAFYHIITVPTQETVSTARDIDWVPKARWVVDGNVWTSSGMAAGSDMALAFLEHLAGAKLARQVRNFVEIPEVSSDYDPFARVQGPV
ncbi:class I glutamine amidotransferase-like protein [Mycena rosella]|uniref:Class I glutamine amidotransferase-like protein n=1 Tax=Mycena rosella TaxID=1033263 RepID=A0AAD7DX96_MYCRO|nr:class I glutamine amidotransferase-like protein [Mycena rosella]